MTAVNPPVFRGGAHLRESIEIRACARDLRSSMDPENVALGVYSSNSADLSLRAIYLGPWIIALDSPAIPRDHTTHARIYSAMPSYSRPTAKPLGVMRFVAARVSALLRAAGTSGPAAVSTRRSWRNVSYSS